MTTIRNNAELEKALTEFVGGTIYADVVHGRPFDQAVQRAIETNERHEWTFESDGAMDSSIRHSGVWLDDMGPAIDRARELVTED